MKKNIWLLIFCSCVATFTSYAQVNQYDQTVQPRYQPLDYKFLSELKMYHKNRSDNNRKYLDATIDWLFQLKGQTEDRKFRSKMDVIYATLKPLYQEDLASSNVYNAIKSSELEIKEEIDSYNSRIAEANNPKKYWDEAIIYYNNRYFSEAIEGFTKVIELAPEYADSYFYRGSSYYSLKNMTAAIKDYSKLIELTPNDAQAYSMRGWAYYYSTKLTDAMSDFNKQIELAPDSSVGYYNRGSAKSQLNDNYGAISDYTKAIERSPNFSMAYNNRGWSKYEMKKYEDALIDLNKSLLLDKDNWVAWDSRQEIKFAMNNFKGCIDDCNAALALNPKIANSYFYRGRACFKQGNKQQACEDWSKAGELGKTEAYDFISKYCK